MKKPNTAAARKYHKSHGRAVPMWYHSEHDADILEQLDKQPNKSGYIKRLIRADIARKREDNGQ